MELFAPYWYNSLFYFGTTILNKSLLIPSTLNI